MSHERSEHQKNSEKGEPNETSPPSVRVRKRTRTQTRPEGGLPPLVETVGELRDVAGMLAGSSSPTAIDTERAGGYRYDNHTFLVQIRREDVGTFIIDTGRLRDLSILQQPVEGQWIFHAADQDLLGLQELRLKASRVFDTEVAARLIGHTKFSLGALVETIFDTRLLKSHQNEDWSRRPIPEDWLRYAALDVEFLPRLHAHLEQELRMLGREEFAEQEFAYMLENPLIPRTATWRDTKGIGKIKDRRGLEVVKQLWLVRDRIGQQQDTAPGRILPNAAIIAAAQQIPESRKTLRAIPGIRKPSAREHFAAWEGAIAKARSTPKDRLPELRVPHDPLQPPPARVWKRVSQPAWQRLQAIREVVSLASKDLKVEPDVVLEPRVQREATWEPLQRGVEELDERMEAAGARPWQRALVGEKVLSSPELLKRLNVS